MNHSPRLELNTLRYSTVIKAISRFFDRNIMTAKPTSGESFTVDFLDE